MSEESPETETPEIPEITFETGIPGFPDAHRFALVSWDEGVFSTLKCLDDPVLEFVVVPPIVFYPEYEPEIDDTTVGRLDISTSDDALLLSIVSIAEDNVEKSTINLLGPIVINRHTRQAAQAVLQGTDYEVHHPLMATATA